jgi:hypothetical protein
MAKGHSMIAGKKKAGQHQRQHQRDGLKNG